MSNFTNAERMPLSRRIGAFLPFGPSVRRGRRLITYSILRLLGSIFSALPAGFVVFLLVLAEGFKVPGRSVLCQAYYPVTLKYYRYDINYRFSTSVTRLLPRPEVHVLMSIGAFAEAVDRAYQSNIVLRKLSVALDLVQALFCLGRFEEARDVALTIVSSFGVPKTAEEMRALAVLHVIAGDTTSAATEMRVAVQMRPSFRQAHQNLAARDPYFYIPTSLDFHAGDDGLIYSLANFAGQRVTHIGAGDEGPAIFTKALKAQRDLQNNPPQYSSELDNLLRKSGTDFQNLVVLPREWSTQIGHLGMLDILFRMRKLGWWKGHAILNTTTALVANPSCLSLFENECKIVDLRQTEGPAVAREFKSLEYWKAMTFNVFEMPDGEILPWQDAGAQLMQAWESQGLGFPLREEFDRKYLNSPSLRKTFDHMRKLAGIPEDAWFVCLHVREPSHYAELPGVGQTHRNASIENYMDAIKHVTANGGWVIRMGGPRSPKLPKMPNVYDYSRSLFRSGIMDLFLIRNARYFIGTTSGLTNIAVSFGIPCALVNCITTDAQLWGKHVRFALKWIRLPNGTYLTQRDITSSPWRWRFFTAEYLLKNGGTPIENSPEEILEVVKEVEAIAEGKSDSYLSAFPNYGRLIERWIYSLSVPYYYGNARPSAFWVTRNQDFLERDLGMPADDTTA